MKNILILILKNGDATGELFQILSQKGFNSSVLIAKSLKHILQDDEEDDDRMFFNLRHLATGTHKDSCFSYFILDDEDLKTVKDLIRKYTNNFKDVRGGMYSYKIDNYEGSI